MTTALERVIVADHGVDACLVDQPTGKVLVVRPGQTVGSAVAAISAVMPYASLDVVRRLVREHLPEAIDLDELIPAPHETAVGVAPPPATGPRVWCPFVAVMVLVVVGFVSAHHQAAARMATVPEAGAQPMYDLPERVVREGEHLRRVEPRNAEAPRPGGDAAPAAAGGDAAQSPPPAEGVAQGSSPDAAGADPENPPPAADEPLPDCPPGFLDTLADAYLSDGPTSSTSSSITVRFSPSLVSYERALRLPCTTTLMPRVKDSATFSAACRQIEQVRNSASPSLHSLLCRSNTRGVEAILKLATAAPEGVNRSSGSSTRLPTTVIEVSPDTGTAPSLTRRTLEWLLGFGAPLGD